MLKLFISITVFSTAISVSLASNVFAASQKLASHSAVFPVETHLVVGTAASKVNSLRRTLIADPQVRSDPLTVNKFLLPNQYLTSQNRLDNFILQSDRNLVLYDNTPHSTAVWATNTAFVVPNALVGTWIWTNSDEIALGDPIAAGYVFSPNGNYVHQYRISYSVCGIAQIYTWTGHMTVTGNTINFYPNPNSILQAMDTCSGKLISQTAFSDPPYSYTWQLTSSSYRPNGKVLTLTGPVGSKSPSSLELDQE